MMFWKNGWKKGKDNYKSNKDILNDLRQDHVVALLAMMYMKHNGITSIDEFCDIYLTFVKTGNLL